MAKQGHDRERMISFYKKEGSYDGGVTMDAANACSLTGFSDEGAKFEDEVINDKDTFGSEFGTTQEIVEQRVSIPITIPRAKPNDLAGLFGLAQGDITSVQDAALIAYTHTIKPISAENSLPSCQVEEKVGGRQYKFTGVKLDTLKIAGEAGKFISVDALLRGSGSRATSATGFAAAITESWLRCNLMKAWLESGSDITISGSLVQDAEDISSAAPVDVKAFLKSFEINWNNNLNLEPGFGGAGVIQNMDHKRRAVDFKFSLLFQDYTEFDHYMNQDILAMEFDLKGAQVTGTSSLYFGAQLIIPKFRIKNTPHPKGGVDDLLVADFECDVEEDGTNDVLITEVYNAQAAYLAA